MSDVYTSVTNRSFGSNLADSIKSFLVGILMFIASFPLLYWNEGRTDMSAVAKTAVVVPADGSSPAGEGKLVAVTGGLKADEKIGDPDYLAPGDYLKLDRKAEMFAWVEKKETRTEKKLGGGSREITTYTYSTEWTKSPKASSEFEHPEDHVNPRMPIEQKTFYAKRGFVGVFEFEPTVAQLPPATSVQLGDSQVKIETPAPAVTSSASASAKAKAKAPLKPAAKPAKAVASATATPVASDALDDDERRDHVKVALKLTDGVLFHGKGSIATPEVGDLRVTFDAVMPSAGPVTLYGERGGAKVSAYVNEKDDRLYRVVEGTHEQAMALLHDEHVTTTWVLRGVGFFLMWIGLALTIAPLNTVLDVVPFVGSAGRFITGVIMFPIALVLSVMTIVISILAHNPILLLVPLGVMIAVFVGVGVMRRRRAA